MNSSVTRLSEISVMSSSCFEISESKRSNGPSNSPSATRKVAGSAAGTTAVAAAAGSLGAGLGDGATRDQFPRQLAIGLGGRMLRSELGDRGARDRGVRKLHRARDH